MKTKGKIEPQKEENRALEQAQSQVESIVQLVQALREACHGNDDSAQQAILEDALSVEVRSDWHAPGTDDDGPAEYKILLCWGGPAVQIVGELDTYRQPETARVQYQDWGTYWTDYHGTTSEQDAALLEYAQQFYFGE